MRLVGALGVVAALAAAPALAEPAPADKATKAAAEAPAPEAPKKRRLKFKSDKPCTCSSALGEADIEAALKRAAADPQPGRNEK